MTIEIVRTASPIEAGIFPGSPAKLSTEELVEIAVGTFQRVQDSIPYIIELRKRFRAAPRGNAQIGGCDTWEQFCEKHLHRTASAIRKALQAEQTVPVPPVVEPWSDLQKRLTPLLPLEGDGKENKIPELVSRLTRADINDRDLAEHVVYLLERASKQFTDYAAAIKLRLEAA
jgi:hypothetical protein